MGLSRGEFFGRVGLLQEVDPITNAAYKFIEMLEAAKPNVGHGRNQAWHTSFHGSAFPGNDPYACGRKALYGLMDIPRQPFSRQSRQIMDAGKDIENQLVWRWYNAGFLASAPPDQEQTGFEDLEHWLTSTVDSIVVPLRSDEQIVAEVKSKYAYDISEMQRLIRGPDAAHVRQVKVQIGLAHERGPVAVMRCYNSGRIGIRVVLHDASRNGSQVRLMCPQHGSDRCLKDAILLPPRYGFLYYVSRDNPVDTFEYYFEYDPAFMEAGRKQLAAWKAWWKEGLLPQTHYEDKRYSHPFNWTWTKSQKHPNSPCQWCDYGQVCREDHSVAKKTGKPTKLSESYGIAVAQEMREDYSLDLVQQAIDARWPES